MSCYSNKNNVSCNQPITVKGELNNIQSIKPCHECDKAKLLYIKFLIKDCDSGEIIEEINYDPTNNAFSSGEILCGGFIQDLNYMFCYYGVFDISECETNDPNSEKICTEQCGNYCPEKSFEVIAELNCDCDTEINPTITKE